MSSFARVVENQLHEFKDVLSISVLHYTDNKKLENGNYIIPYTINGHQYKTTLWTLNAVTTAKKIRKQIEQDFPEAMI